MRALLAPLAALGLLLLQALGQRELVLSDNSALHLGGAVAVDGPLVAAAGYDAQERQTVVLFEEDQLVDTLVLDELQGWQDGVMVRVALQGDTLAVAGTSAQAVTTLLLLERQEGVWQRVFRFDAPQAPSGKSIRPLLQLDDRTAVLGYDGTISVFRRRSGSGSGDVNGDDAAPWRAIGAMSAPFTVLSALALDGDRLVFSHAAEAYVQCVAIDDDTDDADDGAQVAALRTLWNLTFPGAFYFGTDVSLSEGRLAVAWGLSPGAIFLYEIANHTGADGPEDEPTGPVVAQFVPEEVRNVETGAMGKGHYFGSPMVLRGNTLLTRGNFFRNSGSHRPQSSLYVFERDPVTNTWSQPSPALHSTAYRSVLNDTVAATSGALALGPSGRIVMGAVPNPGAGRRGFTRSVVLFDPASTASPSAAPSAAPSWRLPNEASSTTSSPTTAKAEPASQADPGTLLGVGAAAAGATLAALAAWRWARSLRRGPRVFISYRQSSALYKAQLLAEWLGAEGFDVWLDQKTEANISVPVLKQAVQSSSALVLFLSDDVFESSYVILELQTAMASGVPIVCVRDPGFAQPVPAWLPRAALRDALDLDLHGGRAQSLPPIVAALQAAMHAEGGPVDDKQLAAIKIDSTESAN